MSELKSFIVLYDGKFIRAYEEKETDKAIAELEERIADGDRDFEIVNHQNEKLLKIVCNHKYKRCLAMAKLCHWKMGVFIYKEEKNEFYYRWYKRWLKIAEQFKDKEAK